jgi:hypothetical protein
VAGSLRRLVVPTGRGVRTAAFDMVGATWKRAHPPPGRVQVRVRHGTTWDGWHRLSEDDAAPDSGSPDAATARRHGSVTTAPLWVGRGADGVAIRVVGRHGEIRRSPAGLRVVVVESGSSAADSPVRLAHLRATSHASAAGGRPVIYTRRDWGADERIREHATGKGCGTPKYGSSVRVAFVHHTDTPNGYSRSAVPAIIRSMYRYHVLGHGWCDIGYNFLVDRFGRIWQGRYGGMSRPVIGAQAGGFNVDSLGVALIGTFNSASPDRAMREALVRLLAWRLAANFRDPMGRETLTATRFRQARFRAGRRVSFRVISGHRNADYTDCPGRRGYAALPAIRRAVLARLRSGLVDPTPRGTAWRFGQPVAFDVRATALKDESWTLTVLSPAGAVVDSASGQARSGDRIHARWDGRTNGPGAPFAPAGRYTLLLTPRHGSQPGVAYRARATVAPEVTIQGPATAGYGSAVTLHGEAIPGATVTVSVSGHSSQFVTASASGTWSASYVATATGSWAASAGSGPTAYTTPAGRTTVVPLVTSPRPAGLVIRPPSRTFTLAGTAPPLAVNVSVVHDGTVLATSGVGVDGRWSTTITVTRRLDISIAAGVGATSPTYTVVPP